MQKTKNLHCLAGAAALALLFGATNAMAQASTATQPATSGASSQSHTSGASAQQSGKSTLSRADQNIMHDLAQANLSEIETGKVALQKSNNDQVKTYAQKMIDDHTQAQKDLEQLAQAKGVTLPTEPDNKHQSELKKLSSLEGEKFDKRYLSQGGLSDHRNTHRLLERAQSRATDPDLKALVSKVEPVVSQHLTMAKDLQSGKSSTSGSSMGPAGTSSTPSSSSGSAGSSSATEGTSGSSNSGGASR